MMASTTPQHLRGFGSALVQAPLQAAGRPRRLLRLLSCSSVNVVAFKISEKDSNVAGIGPSAVSFGMTANGMRPRLLRGQRKRTAFATSALPADTYWITAFQAVGVSVLMALTAVISGIVINIGIEIKAVKEFVELEKEGKFKEEDYLLVPDEDFGGFENEEDLYIFTNKDMTGNRTPRNRPVREAELQEVGRPVREAELQEVGQVPNDQ